MINSRGIVQNNSGCHKLQAITYRKSEECRPLTKKEEREMIDLMMSQGKEKELRNKLVLHNIQMVFSIGKKYCQNTRDFDNMIARGLYGLVYASNRFNLYEPIMIHDRTDPLYETDRKNCRKIPKLDKDGNPDYIKFNTYATNWVFKYIVDEFERKSIEIDNNSISINDTLKINNSSDNKMTMENYINNKISPEFQNQRQIFDGITEEEISGLYKKIFVYVKETNELTSFEKQIIVDTFYKNRHIKDIAEDTNESPQYVMTKKKEALKKIKEYLNRQFKITMMGDLRV